MSEVETAVVYQLIMSQFFLAVMKNKKNRTQRRRRFWVREILSKRDRFGASNTLVNEMLISDSESFYNYSRMTKKQFLDLLQRLAPYLQKHSIRKPINERTRLLITLRFLITGATYCTLSYEFRVGKTTVHKIIKETTRLIWDILHAEFIQSPTEQEMKQVAAFFYSKTGMPNCIGAIDGKHCLIKAPANSGSIYRNYKKTFSIVLLAICDANYMFTYVNIGAYGSESDGGILRRSAFGNNLLNNAIHFPADSFLPNSSTNFSYFLVGDEAFPLKRNLLRPYGCRNLSPDKQCFNKRLSSARRYIENTFGILASKFRIYHTTIFAEPIVAQSIIKSTVVLHNFIRKTGMKITDTEERDGDVVIGNWESRGNRIINFTSNHSAREPLMLRDTLNEYLLDEFIYPTLNEKTCMQRKIHQFYVYFQKKIYVHICVLSQIKIVRQKNYQ